MIYFLATRGHSGAGAAALPQHLERVLKEHRLHDCFASLLEAGQFLPLSPNVSVALHQGRVASVWQG